MAALSDDTSSAPTRAGALSLPPPPFPPPSADVAATRVDPHRERAPVGILVRPGDITPAWRIALGVAWVLAFFGYAAIWQASVQIGIGTWWIGPRAQPANIAIKMLPFALALGVAVSIVYDVPRVLRVSSVAVALAALIALPDFSRSSGLGTAEAIVAALVGIVTLAASSGRYRPVSAHTDEPGEPALPPTPPTPAA